MVKYLLTGIITVFITAIGFAQTGAVKGIVYDTGSGEPVIFANVFINGTVFGTTTDLNGYFNLTKIPSGSYVLTVTQMSYDTLHQPINITPTNYPTLKLYLNPLSITLDELVISASKEWQQTRINTSVTAISPKQLSQLPTFGAVPDIAQYMQVVPGVVFSGDRGGQLYIRGGTPIQNKVLLDGMTIFNPFHSIGLFSVFDADIIKNTSVYTGGFNAEYGGRISSVMDISTRDGNKSRLSGKLSGDTFGAKLLLEGPLKTMDKQHASLSYLVSAKTSYLNHTDNIFYDYASPTGLPFSYTDLYGKLSLNSQSGSKVNVFGFKFTDKVDQYQSINQLNWNAMGAGANIVLVPSGSNALVTLNGAWSSYDITLQAEDNKPRYSQINGFNLLLDASYFFGLNQLNYGVEVLSYKTNYEFYNANGANLSQSDNSPELAGYIKYKFNLSKLIIEPGFRIMYYASLPEVSPEPRIGIKYLATTWLRIKASAGLYSQNLVAANSDKDVVNLFYGFLTGPQNLPTTFNNEPITSSLQKSQQVVAGFEIDASQNISFNVEGYYKHNPQITEINRNKLVNNDAANAAVPDLLKNDFAIEQGRTVGVDLVVKYDTRQITLYGTYSLSKSERTGEFINSRGEVYTQTYAPVYDRTHNLNLVANYTFGKKMAWEFGGRWNYGSGFPFTQNAGYFEKIPFNNGLITDYTRINGTLAYIPGQLNQGRLPAYHRLDITLKHTIILSAWSKLEITGSVTNVYNRQNLFYVDRISHQEVYQLPVMPSIGASLTF